MELGNKKLSFVEKKFKRSVSSLKHEVKLSSEGHHIELLDNIKKEFDKSFTLSAQSQELRNKVFDEITKHKKSQKGKLNYSFSSLLGIALCFCFHQSKKNSQIFELGEIHLNSYMDYLGIVKLLQEFEKLKSIIFSKDRRDLFEHAKKETIKVDPEELEKSLEEARKEKREIDYESLYTNYKNLCFIKDKEKLEFDERLLSKVDSEIKLPFDMILSRERILQGKKWSR